MTVNQLKAYAKERDIILPSRARKQEIISTIMEPGGIVSGNKYGSTIDEAATRYVGLESDRPKQQGQSRDVENASRAQQLMFQIRDAIEAQSELQLNNIFELLDRQSDEIISALSVLYANQQRKSRSAALKQIKNKIAADQRRLERDLKTRGSKGSPGILSDNKYSIPARPQRALGDPDAIMLTPLAELDMHQIRGEIDQIVKRLPDGMRVELQDRLVFRSGSETLEADAQFDPEQALIKVSLATNNPVRHARHEEIHAYRQLGLFSDEEWNVLTKYATDNRLREEYDIDGRYGEVYGKRFGDDPDRLEETLIEETIAEMWADRVGGKEFGGIIDAIIDRIQAFLRRVARALSREGYLKIDDVYRRIDAGEVGARDPSMAGAGDMFSAPRKPIRAYHGTPRGGDIDKFHATAPEYNPDQNPAVFFARDQEVAEQFSRVPKNMDDMLNLREAIYPVDISPDAKIFDFRSSRDMAVFERAFEGQHDLIEGVRSGMYAWLQKSDVQKWLKDQGYDGWSEVEYGSIGGPESDNIAMFRPGKVTSPYTGNTLFSFAGRRAANADLDALRKAEGMELEGRSRDDIWTETGWFRGVDGKWRWEIDDSQSMVDNEFTIQGGETTGDLGDVMYHPDLLGYSFVDGGQYPGMQRTQVTTAVDDDLARGGAFTPSTNSIRAQSPDADGARGIRGILHHELQIGE